MGFPRSAPKARAGLGACFSPVDSYGCKNGMVQPILRTHSAYLARVYQSLSPILFDEPYADSHMFTMPAYPSTYPGRDS